MKLLDATGERDARWGRLRETALCTSNRQLFAQYLKVAQMPGLMRNAAHPAGDPGIKVYFGGGVPSGAAGAVAGADVGLGGVGAGTGTVAVFGAGVFAAPAGVLAAPSPA